MNSDKLTMEDVRDHCRINSCINGCKYMDNYCHIMEFMREECEFCERRDCEGCRYYEQK